MQGDYQNPKKYNFRELANERGSVSKRTRIRAESVGGVSKAYLDGVEFLQQESTDFDKLFSIESLEEDAKFIGDKRYNFSTKKHNSVSVFGDVDVDWSTALRKPNKHVPKPRPTPKEIFSVKPVKPKQHQYDLVEIPTDGLSSLFDEDNLSLADSTKSDTKYQIPSSPIKLPPVVLDSDKISKYFGVPAKHHYQATYRELCNRRNILKGGDDELLSIITCPTLASNSHTGSRGCTGSGSRVSTGTASLCGTGNNVLHETDTTGSPVMQHSHHYDQDALSQSVRQLRKLRVLSPVGSRNDSLENMSIAIDKPSTGVSDCSSIGTGATNVSTIGSKATSSSKGYGIRATNKTKTSFYVVPKDVQSAIPAMKTKKIVSPIKKPRIMGLHAANKTSKMSITSPPPVVNETSPLMWSGFAHDADSSAITEVPSDVISGELMGLPPNDDMSDISSGESDYQDDFEESPTETDSVVPKLELKPAVEAMDDNDFRSETNLSTYAHNSPRARFLAGCLKFNLPPRAIGLLRSEFTTILNLEHHGLGNQFGILFASAFAQMPAVRVLNIADNNLTDESLCPLMLSIQRSKCLEELNLSMNKIGEKGSEALAEYVADPVCTLKSLKLSHAHLVDSVCCLITAALARHSNIEELDFSNNLLGKDEDIIVPDNEERLIASESIGNYIRSPSGKSLKYLKLQWNMIRGIGGMDLCHSLKHSPSLTYVDLSYNSLGTDGCTVLGASLMGNNVLRVLHLSNNSIGPEACFVLCVGAKESQLAHISFDGNPIGALGAQMLMSLAISKRNLLTFTSGGCDFVAKSRTHIIDMNDPVGSYGLSLSTPIGRAMVLELLDVVAMNPYFRVDKLFYLPEDGDPDSCTDFDPTVSPAADGGEPEEISFGDWIPIKLELFEEEIPTLGELEKQLIEDLKKQMNIRTDMEFLERLFEKHCSIGISKELDRHEFQAFLKELGYDINLRDTIALIRSADNDDKDVIDFEDVVKVVLEMTHRAKTQLRDVQYRVRCGVKPANASSKITRYIPPSVGRIRIDIVRAYTLKKEPRTITPCQITYMHRAAVSAHNVSVMLGFGVTLTRCHVKEGDALVNILKKDIGDTVMALAAILPYMITTREAAKLARIHTGNSYERRQKLKAVLGNAYFPLLGHFDGYYALNLAIKNDRVALIRLLGQSLANALRRKESNQGDVSQYGDWYSFRNQVIDGVPVKEGSSHRVSTELFTPMPTTGKLEFDFAGSDRPDLLKGDFPIHDHRMVRLLRDCGLINPSGHHERHAHKLLNEMKRACERSLNGSGYTYWQCSVGRAETIGEYLQKTFYGTNLSKRYEQFVSANQNNLKPGVSETLVQHKEIANSKNAMKGHLSGPVGVINGSDKRISSSSTTPSNVVDDADIVTIEEEGDDSDEESVDAASINEVVDVNDPMLLIRQKQAPHDVKRSHRPIKTAEHHAASKVFMPAFTSSMMKMVAKDLSTARPVQKFAKYKRYESLDSVFNMLGPVNAVPVHDYFMNHISTHFICARHLALLVHLYDDGRAKHSDFGTYRVELIISLFSRVVDLHNIEVVLSQLTPMEHACLLARIGILYLFNPWKADGCVYMDMSRWEERQVAKILIHMDVVEPGKNWQLDKMKATPSSPSTPGWILNESWLTKEGLSKSAILIVQYFSGDGLQAKNCFPNRGLRNNLLGLVAVDPLYMISESSSNNEHYHALLESLKKENANNNDEKDVFTINRVRGLSHANSSLSRAGGGVITWTYDNNDDGSVKWHEIC